MTDISSSLGATIDERYKVRAERLALEKEVNKLKVREKELEGLVLEGLNTTGLTKASGALATASINPTTVATVENWDLLYEYIHEHKYFHLLHRRVSDPAYRELLVAEGAVPGVVPTTITKLSLTKVSK